MKFHKSTISKNEISTASMPGIVFLLLFFFMVSATIQKKDDLIKTELPDAHALTKIEKQFLIKELHVGQLKTGSNESSFKISSNNELIELSAIGHWIEIQKSSLANRYKDQMIIMVKADIDVDMGLIIDIQQELRKHNARKVMYRTLEN